MVKKSGKSKKDKRKKRNAPHSLLSIGHCPFDAAVPIHLSKQCIWKTCEHLPQTAYRNKNPNHSHRSANRLYALKGQSSPGVLQEGQQASNATRQIPQRSSSLSSLLLVVSWG